MKPNIPLPQFGLRYWIERAQKELLAGKIGSARGSMRIALTQEEEK